MQGIPQPFVSGEYSASVAGDNHQLLDAEISNAMKVHIRCQQRGARKAVTTVSGLDQRIDFKKMLRYIRKTYSCNGSVQKDENGNQVIQLTGDKREVIKEFLTEKEIVLPNSIQTHGA